MAAKTATTTFQLSDGQKDQAARLSSAQYNASTRNARRGGKRLWIQEPAGLGEPAHASRIQPVDTWISSITAVYAMMTRAKSFKSITLIA